MKRIEISENGIYMVFEISGAGETCLPRFSPLITDEGSNIGSGCTMLDGGGLRFKDFYDTNDQKGRMIGVTQEDGTGAEVVTRFRFLNGISAVAVDTKGGTRGLGLRLTFSGETEFVTVGGNDRCGHVRCLTGGYVLAWQSGGAEFVREKERGVLRLPQDGGECLISVSADIDGAFSELTRFRRTARRKTRDSKMLGVFFDGADCQPEYMPALIGKAAEIGCNYFRADSEKMSAAVSAEIVRSGMTPAVRLNASDCASAESVCEIIREYRAGHILLPDCADPSLADEILAARRDTVIGSTAAGLDCALRGMLFAVGSGAVKDALYVSAPEQILTYCDIRADSGGERLAAALAGSMLTRMCIRGRLDLLDENGLALVKEAVTVHKRIRGRIAEGLPIFPVTGGGGAYGIACGGEIFLIVTGECGGEVAVRVNGVAEGSAADVIFPKDFKGNIGRVSEGVFSVRFGEKDSAVLLRFGK